MLRSDTFTTHQHRQRNTKTKCEHDCYMDAWDACLCEWREFGGPVTHTLP